MRFYIFAEDGLQRISHRVMDGLVHGYDAMPQFAGTRQKIANVIVELEEGKPARITRVDGSYLHFDAAGKVHESLVNSGFEAMETFDALERSKRIKSTVVDLSPRLKREKWEREHRWELSKNELDAISADLWKMKRAEVAKVVQARGIKPNAPPLTSEARNAVREIETHIFGVHGKLDHLGEAALKALAFEARSRASKDFNDAIWLGIAGAADRRREILTRHRTGSGVWYASIDVIRWDRSKRSGETESFVHERCNSKKLAEEAARRLLVENAKYFSAETSVEARVVCELEWYDAGSDDDDE
ncbi:hypothetical protein [Bradyrhizobium sp. AS23.2]|uniref:hypothetical protein n=1 Tax=Bradyrhizobium sp. AS23.2 TaxID=1680155 RepID=UPI00093CFD07|nr:hypothetical protein [Bradyrhizobium sp. AS23.2]OKO73193.1 hypothetical protein AC630_29095 [Bradyrhizobium sp. AS23.2]